MMGGGYEDKSVTVTPDNATYAVSFPVKGQTTGFVIVYNNDFFYLTGESNGVYLSIENDAKANIRVAGAHPNERTIIIRRYYRD